jgi:ubiquinone/menaquinone biosynthesis C-methylase UbiE
MSNLNNNQYSSYYEVDYSIVANRGIASPFVYYMHSKVEKHSTTSDKAKILEIAAGNGEHLSHRRTIGNLYVLSDYNPRMLENAKNRFKNSEYKNSLSFVSANIYTLPFDDESFDQIVVTCLLHHLADLNKAFMEIKRVIKPKGRITIYVSCDPGVVNRIIRKLIIIPRVRKYSKINYENFIATEHFRHFSSIRTILRNFFYDDSIREYFYPLKLKSWNFNAFCIFEIRKGELNDQE